MARRVHPRRCAAEAACVGFACTLLSRALLHASQAVLALSFDFGPAPGGSGHLDLALRTSMCGSWLLGGAQRSAGAPFVRCAA